MPGSSTGDAAPRDLAPESAEDLYHRAPCGYLTTRPDGTVTRVNHTFLAWTGLEEPEVVGRRLVDLLGGGSRIFHETHYAPLLLLQGEVREIAFDVVCADGRRLPVLVNSLVVAGDDGEPLGIRTTVFDATLRHDYEQELLRARKRAEASEAAAREVALTLQRGLLAGGLTGGDGFRVETRYRPAVQSLEVGGDWYDAFALADGRIAVSVGDVVGRGIAAAGAMGQLRSALRALAGSGLGPGPVLDELDAFCARLPEAKLTTVAYAEIDLDDGRVRYATAGHLPPLVVHDEGDVAYLWGGRSTPLAASPRTEPRPEAEVVLRESSRLLLYTDGLIERRARDIDDGFALLAATAARLHDRPVDEMADRLVEELLADEDHRDDVCLLAICLEPR